VELLILLMTHHGRGTMEEGNHGERKPPWTDG